MLKHIVYFLIVLGLLAPVSLYFVVVDFGVWDKSEHWAELGTTLSGIYTPLLTLLMVLVIYRQTELFKIQNSISHAMLSETKTSNENSFIDTEFESYEKQIEILSNKILSKLSDEEVIEELVSFNKKGRDSLLSLAGVYSSNVYEVIYSWSSIYYIFLNIKSLDRTKLVARKEYNLRSLLTNKLQYEHCRLLDTAMKRIDQKINNVKDSYYYLEK